MALSQACVARRFMTRAGARQLAQDIAALLLVFRAHAIGGFDIGASGSTSGSGRGESARGNGSVETYMWRLRDVACVLSWPEADWLRYRQAQTEPRGSSSISSSGTGSAQARSRHAGGSAPANAKAASSGNVGGGGGGGLFHEAELAALFAAQGVQSLGVAHVRALLAHLMLTRADAERARAEDDVDNVVGDDQDDEDADSDGHVQDSYDDDDDDEVEHDADDNDDDDDREVSSDADHEEQVKRDVASSAQIGGGNDRRGDFERFLDEGFDDEPSSAPSAAAAAVKPASAADDDDVEDIIEFNDEWRVDEEPEGDGDDGMNLR